MKVVATIRAWVCQKWRWKKWTSKVEYSLISQKSIKHKNSTWKDYFFTIFEKVGWIEIIELKLEALFYLYALVQDLVCVRSEQNKIEWKPK